MWLGIVVQKPTFLQPTLYTAISCHQRHSYIRRGCSSYCMSPSVIFSLLLLLSDYLVKLISVWHFMCILFRSWANLRMRWVAIWGSWLRNLILLLISLLLFFLFFQLGLLWLQKSLSLWCFKSNWDEIWQDCSSSQYASVDVSQIFDLTPCFRDVGHDVISCRKVLAPGDWRQSVCSAPIHQPSTSSCSIVSYFLQKYY